MDSREVLAAGGLEVRGEERLKRGGFSELPAQSSGAWTPCWCILFKWREGRDGHEARDVMTG